MKEQLTILIPTSPIPSNPSTAILDETISKLHEYQELRECNIIIMADGVHSSLKHRTEDYHQCLKNIKVSETIRIVQFNEHTHQAEMTKHVLDKYVTTPLILFCEHDTAPIGEIPWLKLAGAFQPPVNYIRFHIFHEILVEHNYLMLEEITRNHIKLQRTIQWSQRPHLAKADWYRDILNRFFSGKKSMIEDVMHSIVQESYYHHKEDYYGLTIYKPQGNMLRSYHSDGRGTDVKVIDG